MPIVQQVVVWFDASNIRYWSAAALSSAAVISLALFSALGGLRQGTSESDGGGRWHHPALFIIIMALMLTAYRWPIIFYPYQLNPDESQMLAQAMKFLKDDPIPWRSVDGITGGPLDSYVMIIPSFLGLPLDFAAARLVGLLCTVGTLSFTFLTLRILYNDGIAKMILVPMLVFYCFTRFTDFVHYSSEQLPVMLLSGAVYLLAKYLMSAPERRWSLFSSGLVLGAVPFSKLQAAPISALLFAGGVYAIVRRKKPSGMSLARQLAAFCGGTLLIPAGIFMILLSVGAFGDFWKSYIVSGLIYISDQEVLTVPVLLRGFSRHALFIQYLVGNLALVLAGFAIVIIFALPGKRLLTHFLIALIYVVASSYIVLKPGRVLYHYLLFLIPPLTLMGGVILGNIVLYLNAHRLRKLLVSILIGFLGIITVFQLPKAGRYYRDNYYLRYAGDYFSVDPWARLDPKASVVTSIILQIASPGEKMVVWGWMPKYFVLTGLIPGTRDAITYSQIEDLPMRAYYRQRFMDDLKAAKPPVFVDSVSSLGWVYYEREKYGHETFKELAEFIRDFYTLVYEIGPGPDDAIRVYALNERIGR